MDENVMKRLVASIKCGSCGQVFTVDSVQLVEQREELWFFKIICNSCHVSSLVAAVIRPDKVPQLYGDLTEAEVAKFRSLGKISDEDLLDMHDYLKGFKGDIPSLFNDEG